MIGDGFLFVMLAIFLAAIGQIGIGIFLLVIALITELLPETAYDHDDEVTA